MTVNKGTPTVSVWPFATAITYGQTLASSSLSGGSAAPAGSFTFTTPTTTPNAGTASQNVTFTPTDNANYAIVSGSAGVTVNKATPSPTLTVTNTPSYDGSAKTATIFTSGPVPGATSNIKYNTIPSAPFNAGLYAVTADFVPTDSANYNSLANVTAGNFTIAKAVPTLAVTNSPLTYNGSAKSATVSGNVSGAVTGLKYNGSPTQPINAGSYSVTANFTPADGTNYSPLTNAPAGFFVIAKVMPTLSVTNSPVTFDGAGHAAQVTGSVAGSVSNILTGGAATQSAVGTYAVTANFIPTDSTNYNSLTGTPTGSFAILAPSSVSVTLQTLPAGLLITVDGGTAHTAPYTFTATPGSSHVIATTSPQGTVGTRYLFTAWSDAKAMSHSIIAPNSGSATYTATFATEYQLTTAVSPVGSGTVMPATNGWYAAGSSPSIIASAGSGFGFSSWSGPAANYVSSATYVTMNGPVTVTANMNALMTTLNAAIGVKSGVIGATRTWPITLTPSAGASAATVQITGLTISSSGTCKPVVTSTFPINLGDIAVSGSATGNVTVNFSSCAAAKQKTITFNVTIGYSSNNGASTGSTSLTGVSQ